MKTYLYCFYLLIIILIYYFTTNSNYVEGDDASTILYHLMDRNTNLQEPYAKYNSGFDYILSFIDNKEEIFIKKCAYYLSFIFSISILFLYILLLKNIFDIKKENFNYSFFFFLPFIIPELLFNTLVSNSTNISYFFAILSLIFYLIFLKNNNQKYISFISSTICFAIALTFRWSIIMFLPIFFSFHLYLINQSLIKIIKINTIHIFISLILGFIFIDITGYTISEFIEIVIWGKKYSENKQVSYQVLFATGSAFLTPLFVFLFVIGTLYFIKINKLNLKNILFIILPILPFSIFGILPSYKFLFPIFPIFLLLTYYGYSYIVSKFKIIAYIILFIGIFFTWFIGIEVNDSKYAFGKAFEYKTPNILYSDYQSNSNKKTYKLSFNSGTYMPTLEGGRPIYGYFYVFLNQWKLLLNNQQKTLDSIVEIIDKNKNIVIVQDRRTAFLQCTLYKYGFKSNMKFENYNKDLLYRDFFKNNTKIRLFAIKDLSNRIEVTKNILKLNKKVIFRSSYSSLAREVFLENENEIFFLDIYSLKNF